MKNDRLTMKDERGRIVFAQSGPSGHIAWDEWTKDYWQKVLERLYEYEHADAIAVSCGMTFLESTEILRIQTIIEGMKAENIERQANGDALAYNEAAFITLGKDILKIQKEYVNWLKRAARKHKPARR